MDRPGAGWSYISPEKQISCVLGVFNQKVSISKEINEFTIKMADVA